MVGGHTVELLHTLRKALQEESQATDTYELLSDAISRAMWKAGNSTDEALLNSFREKIEEIRLDEMHHQGLLYSILETLDPKGNAKFQDGLKGNTD